MPHTAHHIPYQNQARGDRLHPGICHSRYWHLIQLRDRLIEVINSDEVPAGERLLDFGCGNLPYKPLFRDKFTEYLGADLEGNDLAQVTIDPHGRLCLDDGAIDCVLSSQVLEHVIDPALYLSEALRVLKPGGSLILSTHGMWRYHPDPTDLWRWTIDGLQLQISRAGFDVVTVRSIFTLGSCAVQLWQDATLTRIPRPLRSAYTLMMQCIIGLIELRRAPRVSNDACVYIVYAKKSCVAQSTHTRPGRSP